MSSKSKAHGPEPKPFSKKMVVGALVMIIVFAVIIFTYPRIFSPSRIGPDTAPMPLQTPNTAPVNSTTH